MLTMLHKCTKCKLLNPSPVIKHGTNSCFRDHSHLFYLRTLPLYGKRKNAMKKNDKNKDLRHLRCSTECMKLLQINILDELGDEVFFRK